MSRVFGAAAVCLLVAHAPELGVAPLALTALNVVANDQAAVPARRAGGPLPTLPPRNTVGWVEAVVELQVDDAGAVRAVTPLRWSPLPEDILTPALSRWQFRPATVDRRSVPARVMVTALFRPPVLFNTPTPGSPPKLLAQASPDVPFPIDAPPPAYSPLAVADALVLLEVKIAADGRVLDAAAVAGAPPFTQASIDSVRQWTFRPAMRDGLAIEAYAYVIIGFRQPLTS